MWDTPYDILDSLDHDMCPLVKKWRDSYVAIEADEQVIQSESIISDSSKITLKSSFNIDIIEGKLK